jgi:hypothetical protein
MMHSDSVIKVYRLNGGLLATVSDATRHYFGGYYHVRIEISADIPVSVSAFAGPDEHRQAVSLLGNSVHMFRSLEKMAVPAEEIDAVHRHLLESFEATVLPYLQREDFAASYVQSEYRAAQKKSRTTFQR